MTGQEVPNGQPTQAIAWLTRFPPRLWREGRRLGLLILGHFLVFALAIGDDEIVAECVAKGLIPSDRAEAVELAVALALFVAWSVFTIAILRMMEAARSEGRRGTGST